MISRPKAAARQWADVETGGVQHLLRDAVERGWNPALDSYAESNPFFVQRLRDTSLGNWHVALQRSRADRSLDIGCGFGALLAGFACYYRTAFGVEMLTERLRFSALRQGSLECLRWPLAQASGHRLPFRDGSLDLVTMNGVLEWAAYYADGPARGRQLSFLREARRVLAPGGTLAVAIENRFALETLTGMRDTHTGIRLVPAMPRALAGLISWTINHRPYRTWLYSAEGYRRLFREAGFGEVAVLDLISSYNDWDFVVQPEDHASYRLLWNAGWVKSFFRWSGPVRRRLAQSAPGVLGHLNYACLVLGGSVVTVLDPGHPIWARLAGEGVPPGKHRFVFRLREPGLMGILTHDGREVQHVVIVGPGGTPTSTPTAAGVAQLFTRLVGRKAITGENLSLTILDVTGR